MSNPSVIQPRDRLKADAVLAALTVTWGATFPAVKAALAFADPWTFLVLRFALAAGVLAPLVRGAMFRREVLRAGLLLGAVVALSYLTQTVGLLYTTPSRSAFITGLYVVMVPLFAAIFLRRPPGRWSLVGSCLAAVGLYALTWTSGGSLAGTWRGDLLTFGCAVAVSAHILLTGAYARRLPALPLVQVQLAVCVALCALWLPWVKTRFEPHPVLWMGLGIGVFVSSAVAVLQIWGQARTSAIRAALIFSLEPVFGALFSTLFTGEVLGRRELIGGALILLGVVVSELGSYLKASRQPEPPHSPAPSASTPS